MTVSAFSGLLVFVVGGSGVGKDSLLMGAQQALENNPNFAFPRRLITRDAVAALEDHDTITFDDYTRMVIEGETALNWQAHGLGYIIPKSIEEHLRDGKITVCNVSRAIIGDAAKKYPVHIANIVADLDLRAQRLAGRGRETQADIKSRLERAPIKLPKGIPVSQIHNDTTLDQGITSFVKTLEDLFVQKSNV
ncbi:phosphonate metabolism protein/1,5-bisphosphokinase (PRPP-forming) PhnN [Maritalea sp.]|uniref:phosphonate metabolism protein/1,5-bisphosphokinase (PRPP-forming) PhnN n=1 Tax=Maritalea sp. TaxID=2003361 RepID=UPI003EF91420